MPEKPLVFSPTRTFLFFLLLPIVCVFMLTVPAKAHADVGEPCGRITATEGGMRTLRGANTFHLNVGDPVFETDTIETGANGSGTITFIDDTVLEMRQNSRIDIKMVRFDAAHKNFSVGVIEGTAKFITGGIVLANPKGFRLTTPLAYVGIRGTTLIVSVLENIETFDLVEISDSQSVNCQNKATGESVTMTHPGDTVSIIDGRFEYKGIGIMLGDRDAQGRDLSGEGLHVREWYEREQRDAKPRGSEGDGPSRNDCENGDSASGGGRI